MVTFSFDPTKLGNPINITEMHKHTTEEYEGCPTLPRFMLGAFLAVVAGGNETEGDGILKGYYKATDAKKRIALVGKGLVFDTGGINLKPGKSMLGMHGDMQGSAVALALFLLLEEENFPFDIELSLAIAENKIGPGAYKPNDVVRASNSMSIEVIDTDAEGRMVLADTLALVSSSNPKPDLIIEFSTLTGACVRALGTSYTGIYTNRLSWRDDLIDAGVQSGERVWVFPNDDDFGEALKSPVADIRQCSPDAGPDHILAGHFLKQFVNDIPFVHVDLSASENESGVGPSPGPVSGMGVRFARAFLETWSARNCNDPR